MDTLALKPDRSDKRELRVKTKSPAVGVLRG